MPASDVAPHKPVMPPTCLISGLQCAGKGLQEQGAMKAKREPPGKGKLGVAGRSTGISILGLPSWFSIHPLAAFSSEALRAVAGRLRHNYRAGFPLCQRHGHVLADVLSDQTAALVAKRCAAGAVMDAV
jgi:hypothetical protein